MPTGATPFQTFNEKIDLKAKRAKSFRLNFVFPTSVTAGAYFLVASVDPSAMRDLDLNNNLTASQSTLQVAPPFVQLTGSGLVAPVFGAKPATVSIRIVNSGDVPASHSTSMQNKGVDRLASPA